MSRRRRQALSPSLFPFLAVLVCTLGTLILLLALVAENAPAVVAQETQRAEQDQQPVHQLTADDVKVLIEEAEFRVEQLVAVRDAQVADIENRRDQLAHLEDHMLRLRQDLQRLADEAKMATGEKDSTDVDQQRLADLKQQIAIESDRIEQLKAERDQQTPRVVIVPHKGPNGTDRRPVYLECTAQGLTIWPEGTELSQVLLEDSSANANPLDAALRVIRHHAMKNYGDTVAPYPLLIVRPGGVETYAAARFAMQDWDDQFGYELVPAHVKLAYDVPDPALKQRVDDAIRQAAIKQRGRQRLAMRSSGSGGLTASKSYPTLSAASMDRNGRASGFRNHRDGYAATNPYAAAASDFNRAAGTGADAASKLDQQLREAAGDWRRPGSQQHAAGDPGFAGDAPLDTPGAPGLPSASGISGSPGMPGDAEAGTAIAELTRSGSPAAGNDRQFADGQPSGPESQTNPYAAETARQQSEAGSSATQPGATQLGATQPGATQPSGQPNTAINAMNASGPAGSAESAPTQGTAVAMPSSGNPPPMTMTDPPEQPPHVPDLVRRQGADWALPRSVAQSHGTAIVRTIHVQCYPDRFVLSPARGAGGLQIFGVTDGDINRATLELATAIRDRIVHWGAALPGGRWQPRLDVEIMPRGDSRFHQLRTLMSGSGVDIEGRHSR
jgi:hypothetical protein